MGHYKIVANYKRLLKGFRPIQLQSGEWALKKSLMRPLFFLYFREIRNKLSHWPGSQSALRLYNVPGQHMWVRAGPGPSSGSPKSNGRVTVKITTLPAWDHHWRNPRRKIIESAARVSVHWRAQCHAKWPKKAVSTPAGIEPMSRSPNSLRRALTIKP